MKNSWDTKKGKRPLAIDLFAGVGGLSLGFEQAGFEIVAAVEIDPVHCAIHEYNFPYCRTICSSVTAISGAEIRTLSGIGKQEISVVIGGAPCQGFSLIGKRSLDDPRNRLVYHFVRLVAELKPAYFVFENVKGLTIGEHRRFLEEIIAAFHQQDYRVLLPYQVLNAVDFGVPQTRKRLFLLGARSDRSLPQYPQPITQKTLVWQAITDLPEAEDYPELLQQDWVEAEYGTPSLYGLQMRSLVRNAPPHSCSNQIRAGSGVPVPQNFGYLRAFNAELLTASLRTVHTSLSRQRFATTPQGKVEPISHFFKLHPEGFCNTLRAGTASNRGAHTSPRPIHPFVPRCITNREAARLHSYPDWFRFHVTKWHGFRQIGNSVPPLLGQAIATEIAKAMSYRPQQPEEVLKLGDDSLLSLDMTRAARYFGVSKEVVGKRLKSILVNPETES